MSAIDSKKNSNGSARAERPSPRCVRLARVPALVLFASLFAVQCSGTGVRAAEGLLPSPTAITEIGTATPPAPPSDPVQNATQGGSPQALLQRDVAVRAPSAGNLLSSGSRAWAGAPALVLRHARPQLLLAENVLASAGDGRAAAAARADGTILLFADGGGPSPSLLTMPGGHPAFALALSADGSTLVAWSQGTGEFVSFDLSAGPAKAAGTVLPKRAPLSGGAALALSSDGLFLAALDGDGALWCGARGDEMRPLGRFQGRPALLGFSAAGGVLVAVDESGAGGIWNPRTGHPLRLFSVPGGPFVKGEAMAAGAAAEGSGAVLRLWRHDGTAVAWDTVRAALAEEQGTSGKGEGLGTLRLRRQSLFYVGGRRTWIAAPDYEPLGLALSWSAEQRCLRLQDLDGVVRYYSSESGAPRPQCFAVDWSPLTIEPGGRALLPGLTLRIFDVLTGQHGGSKVNARALSERIVYLWTEGSSRQDSGHAAAQGQVGGALQSVAVESSVSVPLRGGIADEPVLRTLAIGQ